MDCEKEFDVVRFYLANAHLSACHIQLNCSCALPFPVFQGSYISHALAMHHCSGCYKCPDCVDFGTAHLTDGLQKYDPQQFNFVEKIFQVPTQASYSFNSGRKIYYSQKTTCNA